MNYIELVRQFWQCNNEIPIGVNATALYFYMLNVCNSLGWRETFRHSDRRISIQLGISVNTVRSAKNRLKQLGLIDFRAPEKKSRGIDGITTYKILTISPFDTVPDTVVDTVPDTVPDTVVDTVPDTLNKLNKTKLIDIEKINKKENSDGNLNPNTKKEKSCAKKEKFTKPTPEAVQAYCVERGNTVDAGRFWNYYEANGWRVGKNPMKDWHAAVHTWEKNSYDNGDRKRRVDAGIPSEATAAGNYTSTL